MKSIRIIENARLAVFILLIRAFYLGIALGFFPPGTLVNANSSISNFVVYSDAGIPGPPADVFTWSASGCSPAFNGDFEDKTAPEGRKSFRTSGPSCAWIGWGVFKRANMAPYAQGQIRFWLKSTKFLRLELEGPQNQKSGTNLPPTDGRWQEIAVPVSTFDRVNLSQMFGLFLITSTDGPATFYVDDVRWLTAPTTNARLVIRTNGLCPLPSERVISLEINRPYTFTARTFPGYLFTNWSDGIGQVVTNDAALNFVMQSNLVLVANYVDVSRPAIAITTPMRNTRLTNALITIKGTAKDTGCVERVLYRLNDGPWREAIGTTNWLAEDMLVPGTNTVRVYCVDTAGNRSISNIVSCVYVALSPLRLVTNGSGTVRGKFAGNMLEIGRNYTVTAKPGSGQVFSNWTGGYVSTNPTLTFIMQSNLVLTANFVANPFIPLKGDYHGLFYPTNEPALTNSGYFLLNLTDRGAFSGKLRMADATLSFSSKFSVAGQTQFKLSLPGSNSLLLSLSLNPAEKSIDGWVTDGVWLAPLTAGRGSKSNAFVGSYTIIIAGTTNGVTSPAGYGAGKAAVSAIGGIQITGTTADGAPVTQNTVIFRDGTWPLFARLYAGHGLLLGWMQCRSNALALWIKSSVLKDKYYSNGFHEVRTVLVAPYRTPAVRQSVLGWTNGTATFGNGNLTDTVSVAVQVVNDRIQMTGHGITNLVLTLSRANGLFKGSFVHPTTHAKTTFRGVVVQDPTGLLPFGSGGWFLGTNQAGFILLDSTPPLHPSVRYQLNGLNFSPYLDGQDPSFGINISIEQLRQRMRIIRPYTQWIRTFGCTHGLENAGQVARELNLKTALGAWLSPNLSANETEIANLISVARQGQADVAIVGSEVLLRGDLTEGQLLGYLNRVKQELPDIPVTTADTDGILLAHTNVITAVDLVFVNYYPFWEGMKNSNGIAALHYRHVQLTNAAGSKPVVVSETGWPSDGEPVGKAIPSPENASRYFLNFVSWARANQISYFYFSGFDESWKAAYEGSLGAHWGVWDNNGILKPGNQPVFDGEILPNNWTGAEIPGGLGLPSIEFTSIPSFGSFENLEGQILHVRPADYKVAV